MMRDALPPRAGERVGEGASGPRPGSASMLAEVAAGLRGVQKTLPSKYFYDERGSRLFEEITELPEYYLTRAERAILERWAPRLVHELRPRTLVELGAGSASKTRLLLDAMRELAVEEERGATYVPVDVSADFLESMADALRVDYPMLHVRPLVADMTQPLPLPSGLDRPLLLALLGSTIGNFDRAESIALFSRARRVLRRGDHLLIGADLRKDPGELVAAYDDARGVTAEFNRNVLRVLNRELGADFDLGAFEHRAVYRGAPLHQIEMHLVARGAQHVRIPGIGVVELRDGESIRTEISCKYDRGTLETLAAAAGLRLARWITDDRERFALASFTMEP